MQHKVIELCHFALNEDGYLVLGPSESVGRAADLFQPVSKKYRVYRRVGPTRRDVVDIPIVAPATQRRKATQTPVPTRSTVRATEIMHHALVREFAPASVLINRQGEMLCVEGPLDDYLAFPPGEVTRDLIAVVRKGIRTKVRAAWHRASRLGEPASYMDARVMRDGTYVRCAITVRPLAEPKEAEGLFLVTFRDLEPDGEPPTGAALLPQSLDDSTAVQQLEHELTTTREDLQTTIEELESSNEELKASNEDVMSMNEELQSANEELESSKEELQSLNEEISTMNNQLQDKVDQLDRANNDMTNLLASSDVAAVFLSPDLRIRRFTPAIASLLNVVATDVGRPLQDFAPRFEDDRLPDDCRKVLEGLQPIEKTVPAEHGRSLVCRIRPYRTEDSRIEGVVVTFFDVTEQVAAERERAQVALDQVAAARFRRMVEHLPAGAVYLEGRRS